MCQASDPRASVRAPVQITKLILEIEPFLGGSSDVKCEPRGLEQRSRWLKFADLALKKEGRKPSHNEVSEITTLSREEQRAIKSRIHGSVKNFQKIRSRQTRRHTAA
jgi:hypothetical protein